MRAAVLRVTAQVVRAAAAACCDVGSFPLGVPLLLAVRWPEMPYWDAPLHVYAWAVPRLRMLPLRALAWLPSGCWLVLSLGLSVSRVLLRQGPAAAWQPHVAALLADYPVARLLGATLALWALGAPAYLFALERIYGVLGPDLRLRREIDAVLFSLHNLVDWLEHADARQNVAACAAVALGPTPRAPAPQAAGHEHHEGEDALPAWDVLGRAERGEATVGV